jgi:hypothetical protein
MDADYADRLRIKLGLLNAPSLELLRQRMTSVEAELDLARAAMRQVADRAGIKRGGLFEGSRFIERTSGERWAAEARAEGVRHGRDHAFGLFARAGTSEFAHIAAVLPKWKSGGRSGAAVAVDEVAEIQEQIRKDREPDLSSNRQIGAPDNPVELAAAIHKAAARARSATDADPPRETNALSAEILKQGRRRRGEEQ